MLVRHTCICITFLFLSFVVRTAETVDLSLRGKCPNVKFTNAPSNCKLAGNWYPVHYAMNGLQMKDIECPIIYYGFLPNGALQIFYVDSLKKVYHSIARPLGEQEGKFDVTPAEPETTVHLSFIDCDGANYAVALLCMARRDLHGYLISALSHKKTLDARFVVKVLEALKTANLNDTLLANPKC